MIHATESDQAWFLTKTDETALLAALLVGQ
jgi:hypothetical protein